MAHIKYNIDGDNTDIKQIDNCSVYYLLDNKKSNNKKLNDFAIGSDYDELIMKPFMLKIDNDDTCGKSKIENEYNDEYYVDVIYGKGIGIIFSFDEAKEISENHSNKLDKCPNNSYYSNKLDEYSNDQYSDYSDYSDKLDEHSNDQYSDHSD